MKVTYHFDLTDPGCEDATELKIYQNATKMYCALIDISEYMREIRKGWKNDDVDKIDSTVCDLIHDSGINDIN